MNEFDLKRYKTAWRNDNRFGERTLSANEIHAVMNRESKNVIRQLRTGLVLDIVLKSLAAVAIAGLLFLYRGSMPASTMNVVVLGFTLFLLFIQWKTLQDIPRPALAGDSLRSCLEKMISFYRERFIRALYVAAVTGSLVFYAGILYYSWFKYGGIRPLDIDDYVVFIAGLVLAFVINAGAQRWQAGFHVKELEFCLSEIDAESLSAQGLRKQHHRRFRVTLSWLVWLVLGALLLTWFIAR